MSDSDRTSRELLERLQTSVQQLAEETAARERGCAELFASLPASWPKLLPTPDSEKMEQFRARAVRLAEGAEEELKQIEAALVDWLEGASRLLQQPAA